MYDETTVSPEHDEMRTKAPCTVFLHHQSAQLDCARAKASGMSLAQGKSALV